MNSHKFSLLYTTTIVITLSHLLSPVVCFNQKQPSDTTRGLLFEEKKRLGSTPPSCQHKCNQCHPCMAVQMPTLPSQNPFQPVENRVITQEHYFDWSPSNPSIRFSNYKPLGWTCSCGDHFFNP